MIFKDPPNPNCSMILSLNPPHCFSWNKGTFNCMKEGLFHSFHLSLLQVLEYKSPRPVKCVSRFIFNSFKLKPVFTIVPNIYIRFFLNVELRKKFHEFSLLPGASWHKHFSTPEWSITFSSLCNSEWLKCSQVNKLREDF